MKLDKISERVYANTEGETGGNVGIIILEDMVLAIDAQYPVSGRDFRESIGDYTDKPVSHLLLTHIHGDHVFGAQSFEDCEIVAHRRLKEKMEENLEDEWSQENLERMLEDVKRNRPERAYLYEGLRIVLPTETFEDSYTIEDVEMMHMPGHTDGSSIVYDRKDRIVFAGDLTFAETFPWAGDPTANPNDWIKSFERLLSMDVEAFVPGHGPICGKDEFRKQLDWFKTVRKQIKELIADGATEEDVISYEGYPELYPSEGDRMERSLRHWYSFYSGKA